MNKQTKEINKTKTIKETKENKQIKKQVKQKQRRKQTKNETRKQLLIAMKLRKTLGISLYTRLQLCLSQN